MFTSSWQGEEGVCDMMGIIRKEFRDTMTLAGKLGHHRRGVEGGMLIEGSVWLNLEVAIYP